MNSLRGRLRRVAAVLLAGFVAQGLIADRMIVHVGESEMVTRLQHDADSLEDALAFDDQGRLKVDDRAAGVVYTRAFSGHYFVVRSGDQHAASTSFGGAAPPALPVRTPGSVMHLDGPQGQPLLALAHGATIAGREVTMWVAEDLTALRGQLLRFRLLFLVAAGAVFVGALALQTREIGRALRSVEAARDAILRSRDSGASVTVPDAPDEIQPLLAEINRLLAFVERRIEHSRHAIGNLSHALKTPLAVLFRLLEDPRIAAHPELQRLLTEQGEALRMRVERELKRARLAGDHHAGAGFDADAEMPALVALLARIHGDKVLDLTWQGPGRTLPFDREDVLELIGNLADNACKWATSRVDIAVREQDGGMVVAVADDGPGCPPEVLEQLGARGLRTDESMPGHGLGLSAVRDIVAASDGRLEFRRSERLGGLEVVASLRTHRAES